MRKRVLIPKPLDHLPGAESSLEQQVEIVRSPGLQERDLLAVAGTVHGIVATGISVTEKVIAAGPLLEVIATATVGFDKIDVEAATRAAVPVVANTGVAPGPVAEFAIGLMIALGRRIVRVDRDLRSTKSWTARAPYADWSKQMGIDLADSTVGIVGLGNIGADVARRLKSAFGPRLLGYDPYVDRDRMVALGVERVDDLRTLASQVDFLLLHVPLGKETTHLVNREILRAMKPTAFLINCARGPVVEGQALIQALKEEWICGAALDVFEEEPLPSDNELLTMDNVVLTPHIAGVSRRATRMRGEELVRRLIAVLSGQRPDGLVNPEVWPRFLERLGSRS